MDLSNILEEFEVLGMGEIIKKYILLNIKLMWVFLYLIFVYILCYGIVLWIFKFLVMSV